MPSLILLKAPGGSATGQAFPLDGDSMVIGRDAEQCQIAIPNTAVSRKHAVITRAADKFLIDDLGSRNGTFVNQTKIAGPTQLKNEDRVKICDFLFRYFDERAVPAPLKRDEPTEGPDTIDEPNPTVQHTVNRVAAQQFLEVQPSDRLRAILEISTGLSKTIDLPPLLQQVADTLFEVFKQADRAFVILTDEANRLVPRVRKARRGDANEAAFSKTIVRRCLDSLASYLSEDAASDVNLGPAQSIAEFRIRSVMCVPLATAEGKRLGAIQLDTQDVGKKFKEDDLKLLTIVANIASVAVEKAQVVAELLAREKERKEIEVARKVQVGFLPKTFPELGGYEFFAFYSPAQSVGGDYYDFINLPGGRVAVVLGDVAGKGVAAALLMAKLSAEVRYSMLTEPDPAKAVTLLNDQLIRGGIGDRFVTLALLVIDPAAHLVTLVNAGHINPLRLRHASGELTEVISNAESGLPLGLVMEYPYQAKVIPLEVGDTLLVFTDGVTDAERPDGKLFKDVDGVRLAVQTDPVHTDGRPSGLGNRLVRAVQRHADGRPQSDDIALVCVGRTDAPSLTGSNLMPRLADGQTAPFPPKL
jgi:serine phosphatase RsbU (regulator of sigma subunit)